MRSDAFDQSSCNSLACALKIVIAFVLLPLLAACFSESSAPTRIAVGLHEYANPNAFKIEYPSAWQRVTVREGIMVFGPPEVTGIREPGPSVTVYRIPPGGASGSDAEIFENFLARGPLKGEFVTTGPNETIRLGQYQGLGVSLERHASQDLIPLSGKVSMVRANSGAIYIFSATVPTESREDTWPTMMIVLDSVHFNE